MQHATELRVIESSTGEAVSGQCSLGGDGNGQGLSIGFAGLDRQWAAPALGRGKIMVPFQGEGVTQIDSWDIVPG